jgi:hypothetical protein
MSSNFPPARDFSPQDALPPVEPPSAGFILQLFLVPGVIVVVVVMIYLLFSWLAHKGSDAKDLVRALGRNNEARWQAAFNLANDLRAERGSKNPALTNDPELAKDLADILDREIESGNTDQNSITLRIYLCRALGEFRVTKGLPALLKAADASQRNDEKGEVRRAALEGLALLVSNAGEAAADFSTNERVRNVVFQAAEDADPRTRSTAAVVLGVIAGGPCLDKLRYMADDTNPDVRYNAALRLAHHGDVAAVPVLIEMLDPDENVGVQLEQNAGQRPAKRALITINALRAVEQLAEKNSDADLDALKAAVAKLLAAGAQGETRIEATSAERVLKGRPASVPN